MVNSTTEQSTRNTLSNGHNKPSIGKSLLSELVFCWNANCVVRSLLKQVIINLIIIASSFEETAHHYILRFVA